MGGGGKGGSAPPPPDPVATANAQGAANREAALASLETSMINQQTPYGALNYAQTGTSDKGNPIYTATTTLSPEQQQLLNLQQQGQLNLSNLGISQLGRINDAVAQPFSYAGMPAAPTLDDAYIQSQKNSIVQRNQPQMDQERNALIQSLANQGITDAGSPAYMTALDELNRRQNDFLLGADQTAFGQASTKFGLDETARQQAIQEAAYARSQPLNEFNSFMSGSQVTLPQFQQTPQYNQQPADITGPTYAGYQGALQGYNAQQANRAATMGGLFGLGGSLGAAAILSSDRRLKRNIKKCGTRADGLGVYEYEYLWSPERQRGVMADEVQKIYPEAVIKIGGYLAVDYSKIGKEML